ncbi:ATP-NAD kinase-like domain-containing protein [Geopyxis carbonaria]|nr:ATP-NAD kinase-like domain-containing protein [Geopyxis carbonaria]
MYALRRRPPATRWICQLCSSRQTRLFSSTSPRREILPIHDLPPRIHPTYTKCADSKLVSMTWPSPPRNVMIVKKPGVDSVRDSLVAFAEHITTTYPGTSIILEPAVAQSVHHRLSRPVYTLPPPERPSPFPFTQSPYPRTPSSSPAASSSTSTTSSSASSHTHPSAHAHPAAPPPTSPYHTHTDLVATLGGDGTILHAASLFSTQRAVPPFLCFAMGTLGFLGEFKWAEHVAAYASVISAAAATDSCSGVRILQRNRLKAGVFGGRGTGGAQLTAHAMNEISLHRGREPHLTIFDVSIDGAFLTEAVADGLIVSTPTGSTAYSLSSGGSILHPSVRSLLLTPICPRSLSFRPLVLPEDAQITLRLSEKNRGREVEVSVDGRRWGGIGAGQEVRVWLEGVGIGEGERGGEGRAGGGIPCVKRGGGRDGDGWVGGLNGLLKFNYPFGEEE